MRNPASLFVILLLVFSIVPALTINDVVASPSFGYDTKGGTQSTSSIQLRANKFTISESGQAQSITLYIEQRETDTPKIKCAIYDDDGTENDPATLIGYTEEWTVTNGYDDWHTFDMESGGSLSAGDYYLTWWADDLFYFYRDSDGIQKRRDLTYDGWPNPFGEVGYSYTYKASIYCNYTATGGEGQDLTFTLPSTITPRSSLTRGIELSKLHSNFIHVFSSVTMNKELPCLLSSVVTVYNHMTRGIELGRTFTGMPQAVGSLGTIIELSVLDLYFTCTETVTTFGSLAKSLELHRRLTGVIDLGGALETIMQGVAQDMLVTLCEVAATVASMTASYVYSPTSYAIAIAGLALILAMVAIALIALKR